MDQPTRQRRGLLIVLSSPSGAGKSTIAKMLLDADKDVTMSVSATTRPKRRLRSRGTDSDEVIADRMSRAAAEISHWPEYEYVLVNRDMDQCVVQVRSIVAAERLKRTRRIGLVTFVRDLIGPAH